MRLLEARLILLAVEAFVALTSIVYGVGLALGAFQLPLTFLAGSPFSDYIMPGLLMALVAGGSSLLAAALMLTSHQASIPVAALAGLVLLAFEVVEVTVIDRNTGDLLPLVVTLQAAYTALGLTMLGGAVYLWTAERRQRLVRIRGDAAEWRAAGPDRRSGARR